MDCVSSSTVLLSLVLWGIGWGIIGALIGSTITPRYYWLRRRRRARKAQDA